MSHTSSAAWQRRAAVLQGTPAGHHGSLPTEAKSSLPLVACHVPHIAVASCLRPLASEAVAQAGLSPLPAASKREMAHHGIGQRPRNPLRQPPLRTGGSAERPRTDISVSDIQGGVIAPVDGIGDGGYAGGITDDAHKGCAILQCFHDIRTRALPKGRDDAFSGYEELMPFLVFTPDTVRTDFQSPAAGVDSGVLLHFLQQQGTVAHVGIRRKGIPHLHDMDGLAFLAQMDRALTPGKAAAEDDHIVPDFVLFLVVIVDHDHIVALQTGNGRQQRTGAHSDDQGIGRLLLHIFRGHLRIEADLHASLAGKVGIGPGQLVHLVLEGERLLTAQDTAEAALFFAQDDLMAAPGRCPGRIQTAGAAARYQDFFLFRCRQHAVAFHFAPDERIDRTATRGRGRTFSHAGEAAQAADDLLVPVGHDLFRQEGVGQQRTRHIDHVGLVGLDDFFHLGGIVQAADGGHGDGDMLFDLRRQIDVAAMLLEHGRMRVAKATLVRTGGNMQKIDAVFQLPGDGDAVFQRIAALEQLGTAHAEFDGETGAHGLAHGLEHPAGKAATVLDAAPVFVRPVVEPGRQKLVDEPTMPAVDHDHLKARAFGQTGDLTVSGHDLVDHLMGQFAHFHAVGTHTGRRSPLGKAVLTAFVRHVCAGIHTGMGELHAGDGAMPADGICRVGEGGQRIQDGRIQMIGMAAVGLRMHHAFADGDGTGAALGPQLIKGGGLGADAAVVGDVRTAHGRGKHTVAERDTPNRDGFAQMGKLSFHKNSMLSLYRHDASPV